MRLAAFIIGALTAPAIADLSITHPIKDDTVQAGSEYEITWVQSGDNKPLNEIGESTVYLYAGKNSSTQVPLTELGTVNAEEGNFKVTVDPKIGQDGDYYSFRIMSNSLKSDKPDEAKYNQSYTAYSDIFEMKNLTGTFNETMQDATGAKPTTASSSSSAEPTGTNSPDAQNNNDDDDSSATKANAFTVLSALIIGSALYVL